MAATDTSIRLRGWVGRNEGMENYVGEWGDQRPEESGGTGFKSTTLTLGEASFSCQSLGFPSCEIGFINSHLTRCSRTNNKADKSLVESEAQCQTQGSAGYKVAPLPQEEIQARWEVCRVPATTQRT